MHYEISGVELVELNEVDLCFDVLADAISFVVVHLNNVKVNKQNKRY